MVADWFCKIGGKEVGPLSGQQLKDLVTQGRLLPEHPIRRGGDGPWVPAGRVKGLFPAGQAPASHSGRRAAPAAPPVAKPIIVPAAKTAPAPPPADLPAELSVGGHGKAHPKYNVDQFDIDVEPVMVSHRRTRGTPGLKKAEQQKLTMILTIATGAALVLAVIIFVIAYANGLLSSRSGETAKNEEAKTEQPVAEKKTEASKTAEEKPKPEAKEDETWTDSSKPITRGGAEVKLGATTKGAPPENAKLEGAEGAKEALVVNLDVKATKPLDYKGWTSLAAKRKIVLTDETDKEYALLGVVDRNAGKTLSANESVDVQLIFEPTKAVKSLRLELPGLGIGDKTPLKFQIPAKAIGSGGK
jgi:hypothetical protein